MRPRISTAAVLAAAAAALALPAAAGASPVSFEPSTLGPLPPAEVRESAPNPTILIEAASPQAAEEIAARQGLVVKRAFAWIGWYELEVQGDPATAPGALAALEADPDVAATDFAVEGEDFGPQYTPRDTAWNFNVPTQDGGQVNASWHLTKTNFPAAFDQAKGTGVQIGIVDSEFFTDHPDLGPKVRNPRSFASGTGNYGSGNVKADGSQANVEATLHGTHVAGIAAAVTDNGIGMSGAGFDATFVPVQIRTVFEPGGGAAIDAGFVSDLVEALGYMKSQGVSVINLSLGGPRDHPAIAQAIAEVRALGITVVVAAGNNQQQSPNAPMYPAAYPGSFAVANTTSVDGLNPTSSNGNWVDIAAPGTDVFSTWDSRSAAPTSGSINTESAHKYNVISGTSMAAPVVAGLVALMKSVRPDLTPDEVESLIQGTAIDLGSRGHDPQYGWGRIDANRAVAAALAYVRPTPPPPPAPPADTSAPGVNIRSQVTINNTGRRVTIRFRCNEACGGLARVYLTKKKTKKNRSGKGKRIATKRYSAEAGKLVKLTLKTNRVVRSNTKLLVTVEAADAAGNKATYEKRRSAKRAKSVKRTKTSKR